MQDILARKGYRLLKSADWSMIKKIASLTLAIAIINQSTFPLRGEICEVRFEIELREILPQCFIGKGASQF